METREWTKARLEEMGFKVLDSSANFLFASPAAMSGGEYQQKLRERSILIRHFDLPRIRDYVRITVGSMEQMEALVSATKEILA